MTFRSPHGSSNPVLGLTSLFRHWGLIRQLLWREVESRYKGTFAGLAWSLISPLLMLAIYAFVFSSIFKSRWPESPWPESKVGFTLVLFAGLSLYALVQDCIARAHHLVVGQPSYVKRVVFPLETLAWVQLGAALVNYAIALVLLLLGELLVTGSVPLTILLMPLLLLPLCLGLMGLMWFLSSFGVYLRDIGQVTSVIVGGLMFISPIFYPLQAVPEQYRWLIQINPLTYFIELGRDLLLWGQMPNWQNWFVALVISVAVFVIGFVTFQKLRRGFADVL